MGNSIEKIKLLRERTGAGMMECKKALLETSNDIDKAIELLRKNGQKISQAKASRIAAEGIVNVKRKDQSVAMVEVNSETDFVARDDNFINFVDDILDCMLENKISDLNVLNNTNSSKSGKTIDAMRQDLIAKIREKISIRRIALIKKDKTIGTYTHNNRIGVIVELNGDNEALGKDIAMHVAAANPLALMKEDISDDLMAKEKVVLDARLGEKIKDPKILEVQVQKQLELFKKQNSLIGQAFVKNPSDTVGDLLQKNDCSVIKFVRFEVGEGMEKKEDNFLEEVQAQIKTH